MGIHKKQSETLIHSPESDLVDRVQSDGWTYIKSVVDLVIVAVLVLDKNLCVIACNEIFCQAFQVLRKDTEKKFVYELGNGQWSSTALRKLLEDVQSNNNFFKGFEVTRTFPSIGYRTMILNARQIHFKDSATDEPSFPLILLAIEDVTEMMDAAKSLTYHANQLETELVNRAQKLESHIEKLEKEISDFKQHRKDFDTP